jgi:isoquinoline 1-oxidoreductase beta subunit
MAKRELDESKAEAAAEPLDKQNAESCTNHVDLPSVEGGDAVGSLNTSRRRFLQFMLSGSASLVIGGAWLDGKDAQAMYASTEFGEVLDIADILTLAEFPYADNLILEVTQDNRVRFELPRLDMGQGIVTALAQLVADELSADYQRTDVVHSDRRADRPFSMTSGSSTMRTMWGPVRRIAAQARARLITAAAQRWDVDPELLSVADSKVLGPNGLEASYGELTAEAAEVRYPRVSTSPKPASDYTLVGQPKIRKNARDIVTGKQAFTLDIEVPGAMHAVIARSPDIGGKVNSWDDSVTRSIPGVVDVVEISSGIAVIAESFDQAQQGRDALEIQWTPGSLAGRSDDDFRDELERIRPSFPRTYWPFKSRSATFHYPFQNHGMMEVMTAIADVRDGEAELWYASQSPNYVASEVAMAIGISSSKVTMHIPYAGGAFGRRLFGEVAVEAAEISHAAGRPVKLMWTRSDDIRSGRFRPMASCAVHATWLGSTPISFKHRIAAARTDFDHGIGDALTSLGAGILPDAFSQFAFRAMVSLPYRFGNTRLMLYERDFGVPTSSLRSVYSGHTITSNEIFIDEFARELGRDEVSFRLQYLDNDVARRCIEKVAEMGDWGRLMPPGHAQGVAIHSEYRSACAYLVEVDASGMVPRLTRAFCAVDVGLPVNPLGLKAQMEGALVDAWSLMFCAANHIDDGKVRESGFWDYNWARMEDSPLEIEIYIFPASEDGEPGGAGELGVPPASAACVNAYARATGVRPRYFPIGDND